jgi:hypothetical protein
MEGEREANFSFSATFKTTPVDSTGVAHILEHTTLCGSTKYLPSLSPLSPHSLLSPLLLRPLYPSISGYPAFIFYVILFLFL